MRLVILNGPNLNLLGVREPHIYGRTTLAAIQASCEEFAKFTDAQLSFHQSNHEGVLVDLLQSARQEADAIIINPAGYSLQSRSSTRSRFSKGRFSKCIFRTSMRGTNCIVIQSSRPQLQG